MLTPTTAPPTSITPEAHDELTSRTPANFADIPPILRWEDAARVELASPNWTHWGAAAGEGTSGSAPNGALDTPAHEAARGPVDGRLYVTEDAVTFLPTSLTGWTLRFPALTLHALTPTAADRPAHIYCQIDESAGTAQGGEQQEEEYAQLSEMRIFVAPERLESLFVALSNCSALHDSLLPSGEPSSFFGFGGDDDDDEYEDEEDEDADEGTGGRALNTTDAAATGAGPAGIDSDGDAEVDAITSFLAKVDWGAVPPPSGWMEVDESPALGASHGDVRTELSAARARVASLETLLAQAHVRVAELERRVGVEGQFDDE